MSPGSAKLVFILVFIINCVLWSQSRYGQFESFNGQLQERSLVKRISYELTHHDLEYADDQCRPLSVPSALQCAHVKTTCPTPPTFLSFNYLRHYFCTKPPLRPLAFTGLLIWLVFLFSTLGISASDFFTPNLASIAQFLGLDENVAGVTFLAFGNGSPDVFSTFSAMRANSGSLAIGELLGAASFIVSCVVGSMCIIKPFKVHRAPFLRDVGFFTVAVSMLLVILWDHYIRAWESAAMVGMYLFYVAVVVISSWWERKRAKEAHIEALIRAEYQDDDSLRSTVFEPYRDDPSTSLSPPRVDSLTPPTSSRSRAISNPNPPRLGLETSLPPRPHSRTPSPTPSPRISQMPSFSLVGALEFRQVVASLQNQASSSSLSIFESPVTPYAGGHYHSRHHSHSRSHPRSRPRTPLQETNPWDETLGLPLDERLQRPSVLVTPATSADGVETIENPYRLHNDDPSHSLASSVTLPSIHHTPASPTQSSSSDTDTESQMYTPTTRYQHLLHVFHCTTHVLFPTFHEFRSKSVLGQIASVFAAPAVMLLTLTLPVVVTQYDCSPHQHLRNETKISLSAEGRLIEFEEEGIERALIAEEVLEDMHELTFNKWLMATQCALGPIFCVGVLFRGTRYHPWILLATGVASTALAALVAVFADKGNHPTSRLARCSMGFFVAIVWIMAIADEVVQVLQTFGFIFGLSDAIIGLTIFAVGNSLADLVANMSVAVFAPIMGFSACFGGPMLNILLGVGISGSYIIQQTSQPYKLYFSPTLFVSTGGLLVLLLTTLVFVPFNGYFLTRRWGIFLIASYAIIMALNVLVEVRG